MKTQIMEVTPEMAAKWLSNNPNVRRMRRGRVDAIARSIRAGEFQTTHQGIALQKGGALLDGQHRLAAIVETGATVTMMVTFDLSVATGSVIDSGMPRQMFERIGADRIRVAIGSVMFQVFGVRKNPQEFEMEILMDALRSRLDFCEANISGWRSKKKTGSPAALAAMALTIEKFSDHPDQIDILIKMMSKALTGDLFGAPQSVISYYRQMTEGVQVIRDRHSGISTKERFVRAWMAMDPRNINKSKIQIRNGSSAISDAILVFDKLTNGVFSESPNA